jgi:hypothetical protein
MVSRLTSALASAVLAATLAACVASSETASGVTATELATQADDGGDGDGGAVPRGPSATTMAAAVTAAGLDLHNLPPTLDQVDHRTLLKLMQTFATALGVDCTGCHAAGNYSTDTPQKQAAKFAYERIVAKLTMADGSGPLWCDSCHYGKKDFLDRSNLDGVRAWMRMNFVGKLARNDGQPMACTACHDTPP